MGMCFKTKAQLTKNKNFIWKREKVVGKSP